MTVTDYRTTRRLFWDPCPACGAGARQKCTRQTAGGTTAERKYPHSERSRVRNPDRLAEI